MRVLLVVIILVFSLSPVAKAEILWSDWPDYSQKEATWVKEKGLLKGYSNKTFKPWQNVTEKQVVRVAKRGNIRNLNENDFWHIPAKMGWIEENFLPNTVYSAGPKENLTRFRFTLMLYRHGLKPGPTTEVEPTKDQDWIVGERLNKWFAETNVYYGGEYNTPRIVGTGHLWVELSRKYNVPLWLALGQCWRESQWFTTGLSRKYNMGFGIKGSGKWGKINGHVSGFANYVSVEESIRAYFRLMDGAYRSYIDRGDWWGLLNKYAPPFENDSNNHYNTVMTVKRWCEERGIK